MTRVYNFSAGPSQMPEEVLKAAAQELLDYQGSGQSVMEMSHRSKDFLNIIEAAEMRLRKLMEIPNNYKVLFLQGGASLQFAMIPMNLMRRYKKAAYIHTGAWTKKAIKEAEKFGEVCVIASSEDNNFASLPPIPSIPKDIDYLYICENNTIYGTHYRKLPETNGVPLVCDMSSCILSEPVDVSKYGVIFAGAQKNLGMAGLTLVIIREDLMQEDPSLPSMLSYHVHAEHASIFHTPPTYAIYMLGLMLKWLEDTYHSLTELKQHNEKKAAILYDVLDRSKLFHATVKKEDRSLMNIPFVSKEASLDELFIEKAKKQGLINLKGHRSVGGMRASIYNAMPIEGVQKLADFICAFEKRYEDEKN